jgi:hypothetical protein
MGLEPTTFCMAKAGARSRPFAPVRSNRLFAASSGRASERQRTRANAECSHCSHCDPRHVQRVTVRLAAAGSALLICCLPRRPIFARLHKRVFEPVLNDQRRPENPSAGHDFKPFAAAVRPTAKPAVRLHKTAGGQARSKSVVRDHREVAQPPERAASHRPFCMRQRRHAASASATSASATNVSARRPWRSNRSACGHHPRKRMTQRGL